MNESFVVIDKELVFEGGIKGEQTDSAPEKNGIYVAFACIELDDAYECNKILYIGKAEGSDTIKKRISDHFNDRDESDSGKQSFWEANYCEEGEVVVYSYAECNDHLQDIEAAMIKRNQPVANIQGKDKYTGKAWHVYIKCTGQKGCIADTTRIMRLVRGSK
jgi:excinuclease UvrABC nuclease subunit